jgi:alpha-D-xyloside xylohydrolase
MERGGDDQTLRLVTSHLSSDQKLLYDDWLDTAGNLLVREPERGGKTIDLDGDQAARLDLVFSPGEAIYGLGQHEEGILNYRGHCQYLTNII